MTDPDPGRPVSKVQSLAAVFAEKLKSAGGHAIPPEQVGAVIRHAAANKQISAQVHAVTSSSSSSTSAANPVPEWKLKRLAKEAEEAKESARMAAERKKADAAKVQAANEARRTEVLLTATSAPDISGVARIYRSDDRSPKKMALEYRQGFTARVNQSPGTAKALLQEICGSGVDSWMAEWVAGGMMGERPCVSTTSSSDGFGPTRKFFYEINFPGGVALKEFTAAVLGFAPPPNISETARHTGLWMDADTVAGANRIVLAYAAELLFLTPIPENWIVRAMSFSRGVWMPYDPGQLRRTVNRLTDDLEDW